MPTLLDILAQLRGAAQARPDLAAPGSSGDKPYTMMGRVGYGNTPNPQSIAELLTRPPQESPDAEGLGTALGVTGGGTALAQTAFHGSPHKFNKFDMSKVGTGEGAQTFGHGMYFAENPAVAQAYQSNLVKNPTFLDRKTGARIPPGSDTYQWVADRQARMERTGYGADFDKMYGVDGGDTYKVNIPDRYIPKMLDWDKPLAQQPRLLDAINRIIGPGGKPETWTGAEAYQTISDYLGREKGYPGWKYAEPQQASDALRKLGIPGIKYLDQGSRGAGTGTSNYVVFDPKKVRILSRKSGE